METYRYAFALILMASLAVPSLGFSLNLEEDSRVSSVDIQIERIDWGQTRTRTDENNRRYVGAQRCAEIFSNNDNDVTFTFRLGSSDFTGFDVYKAAIPADQNDMECGEQTSDCELIENTDQAVDIESPGGLIRVRLPFNQLLRDELTAEDCEAIDYELAQNQQSLSPTIPYQAEVDAGLDTVADTDTNVGEPDAGSEDVSSLADTVEDTADTSETTQPPEGAAGSETDFVIRIVFDTAGNPDQPPRVDAAIRVDLVRPPMPDISDAQATQNKIQAKWNYPEAFADVQDFWIFYSQESFSAEDNPADVIDMASRDILLNYYGNSNIYENAREGNTRTDAIQGVNQTPGNEIYVGIASADHAENFSRVVTLDSPITVQQASDFWDQYKEAGGNEVGGGGCACSSQSRSPYQMIGLLLFISAIGLPFWIIRKF